MIGRSFHESAELILLGDVAKTILESAKGRLARAGGDLKVNEAVNKCLDSLELASSAGDCSLEDFRTVERELKIAARDRQLELNSFD